MKKSFRTPVKARISEINKLKASLEKKLKSGEYYDAFELLDDFSKRTRDTRSRIACYRLLIFMKATFGAERDRFVQHVKMAAKSGHIPTMKMVERLLHWYEDDDDTRGWERLYSILSCEKDPDYDNQLENLDVTDIINALDEPDSNFYNAREAKKLALKYGLKAPKTLHHDESTFCDEDIPNILEEAQELVLKNDLKAAEALCVEYEKVNPIDGAFTLSQFYHSLRDFNRLVKYVKKGVNFGLVPHMYVMSALYRNGLGGLKQSTELANAWFWLATKCDDEDYTGFHTAYDIEMLPLYRWRGLWQYNNGEEMKCN